MINDNTIAIYVILDDILQGLGHQEPAQRRVSDSMILTTVLIGAWYFGGNWAAALDYMRSHHCAEMLGSSRFCRRVHSSSELGQWCFGVLAWTFKTLNVRQRYILDTFPVAVCHNIRISRCKILRGEAFRGKNASKRMYFYGFKVALLTDEQGNPIELAMYPGAYSEQATLKRLDFDLPPGSIIWMDSGFTDYAFEDYYREQENIEFATQRKKNSKRGDSFMDEVAKKYNRKKIETKFSEITARFPKKIHAVTAQGFQLKVFFVILAFAIIKLIKE